MGPYVPLFNRIKRFAGTELRTTVSTENIIDTPRQRMKGSQVSKSQGAPASIPTGKTASPNGGKFRCACGKFFNSSWNFTQHALACKIAKAKKAKIPAPVKIKSDAASPAKTKSESSSPTKHSSTPSPSKKIKVVVTPGKKRDSSPPGSPLKKYKCHLCKKMFSSSWNYAQHIKSCGSHRRKANITASPAKSTGGSPSKVNSHASSPVKSNVPKSSSKSSESKSPSGSTCKSNKIQSESSDSDDSKSSDEEEVVIKPIFLTEKKQAKQLSANKKKSDNSKDQRSKSPSNSGGGGKEKKQNCTTDDSPPGTPPKLTDDELTRIRQIVNEDEMRCLKCHKQYCTISYLHRHAVRHLGWRRFKCKLCKFTAYNRSECTTHLRKVHTTKTFGVGDMNPFIHDLEPEKMKQEPSVLTRVERPTLQRSNSNQSSTNGDSYNISTRRNTRVFDTKPYVRADDDLDDDDDEKKPDSLTTLRTRKGAYNKPNLLKRKNDDEDDDSESSNGPVKRKRTDSDVDEDNNASSDEIEFNLKPKCSKEDDDVEEVKTSNRKKSPRPQKKKATTNTSDEESEGEEVVNSPSRRKSQRPQKSFNGFASESEQQSSPARSSNIKTSPSVTKLMKQSSGGSPAKMSQKIQDLVQSDVDNILQMVQGNKLQNKQNSIGTNRSDEVVILVVGENKTLSPMKAVSAASPIKLSLAPKVISSPGGAIIATANTGIASTGMASRGAANMGLVSRSPVKILPKPLTPTNNAKVNVFDKLAARQLSQSSANSTVATIPAPVTTVTAGNKSPRRQQSVQKTEIIYKS